MSILDLSEFDRNDWRSRDEQIRMSPNPRFNKVTRHSADVERLRTDRDPCIRCGVRKDRHAEAGCRRYLA